MYVEILINCDIAPMRDIDITFRFCESGKWILESKHELDLVKGDWSDILKWPVYDLALAQA